MRMDARIVGCEFVVAVKIVGVAEILERDIRVMIAVARVREILHFEAGMDEITVSRRSEKVGIEGRGGGRRWAKVIEIKAVVVAGVVCRESRGLMGLLMRVLLLGVDDWERLRPWKEEGKDVRREIAKAFEERKIALRGGGGRRGGGRRRRRRRARGWKGERLGGARQ